MLVLPFVHDLTTLTITQRIFNQNFLKIRKRKTIQVKIFNHTPFSYKGYLTLPPRVTHYCVVEDLNQQKTTLCIEYRENMFLRKCSWLVIDNGSWSDYCIKVFHDNYPSSKGNLQVTVVVYQTLIIIFFFYILQFSSELFRISPPGASFQFRED